MLPIDCVDPTEDWAWQRLVEQAVSTVFHSPEWLRVLMQTDPEQRSPDESALFA